jgi:hypothetical protein
LLSSNSRVSCLGVFACSPSASFVEPVFTHTNRSTACLTTYHPLPQTLVLSILLPEHVHLRKVSVKSHLARPPPTYSHILRASPYRTAPPHADANRSPHETPRFEGFLSAPALLLLLLLALTLDPLYRSLSLSRSALDRPHQHRGSFILDARSRCNECGVPGPLVTLSW